MINILSEYHAKNKDEKSEHAKGKESGKDAPHGTDEEKHHRQNCQHGQLTAQANHYTTDKGTHETYCHIDHETDRQPLHQIFNAGWSEAEASFQILLYFSSLFHNIDFFFYALSVASPCSFQGADTDGEKICKAFGEKFSTAPLDGLKIFRQNPQGAKRACRFLGDPDVALHPEPRKVELLTG